jgi:hypothetical protein
MTTDIKTCVTCKHHHQEPLYFYTIEPMPREMLIGKKNMCSKNLITKIDIITGISKTLSGKSTNCCNERGDVSEIPNRCGIEGKHWIAK